MGSGGGLRGDDGGFFFSRSARSRLRIFFTRFSFFFWRFLISLTISWGSRIVFLESDRSRRLRFRVLGLSGGRSAGTRNVARPRVGDGGGASSGSGAASGATALPKASRLILGSKPRATGRGAGAGPASSGSFTDSFFRRRPKKVGRRMLDLALEAMLASSSSSSSSQRFRAKKAGVIVR